MSIFEYRKSLFPPFLSLSRQGQSLRNKNHNVNKITIEIPPVSGRMTAMMDAFSI
ncbi:hypothetical protein IID62_05295 [candidate division KSB1 bacterium]|nr:hypothetical protein [candidate division KSB1 bacterium]